MSNELLRNSLDIAQKELDRLIKEEPQEIERCKTINALVALETMLFYPNPFMPSLQKSPKQGIFFCSECTKFFRYQIDWGIMGGVTTRKEKEMKDYKEYLMFKELELMVFSYLETLPVKELEQLRELAEMLVESQETGETSEEVVRVWTEKYHKMQ